jgi:hypothetical protein
MLPPIPRDEVLATAGMGYRLGVSLTTSGNFGEVGGSGMVEAGRHESGIRSDAYGSREHLPERCPECPGLPDSHRRSRRSSEPHYYPSSQGGVNSSEVGECMSRPSSAGTDCTIGIQKGTNL